MAENMVLYDMGTWDHVMAVIICIFAPIMAFTSGKITTEEIRLEPEDKIRLYHSNGLLLIVFGLIVLTVWRIPNRPMAGLGIEWPVWHPYVFVFLILVLVFYRLDVFFQYGQRKWRERTYQQRHKIFSFVPADSRELVHFMFLAIAAGIGEEIIFRGYLIHYVIYWTGNTFTGILIASVFSSALFAFLHGYQGFKSILKIFFLALMFCGIFVYSQSLLIVIIVHALIDTFSGIVGIYLLRDLGHETEEES